MGGGLFDFNATLPIMAIQFILLTVVLTFVFYKPLAKLLDGREKKIDGQLNHAAELIRRSDEYCDEYNGLVKTSREKMDKITDYCEKYTYSKIVLDIEAKRKEIESKVTEKSTEIRLEKACNYFELYSVGSKLSDLIVNKATGYVLGPLPWLDKSKIY